MKLIKYILFFVIGVILAQSSLALLQLDNVVFDPAIISAGDEVTIVVQYSDNGLSISDQITSIGNEDFTFKTHIESDDSLTEKYVIVQDSQGDSFHSRVYAGDRFNRIFKVKVLNNAPAGNYQFKLVGQWYKNDKPIGGERIVRFYMPVKKEGIIMGIGGVTTTPSEVRSGDDFVTINANIENSGEKDAKAVEVKLTTPTGFKPSYSDNNRKWIGRINAGDNQKATFFIDINDSIKKGTYNFKYFINYRDLDDNTYNKTVTIPFLVKSHPYFKITNVEGVGTIGKSTKLKVTIKNIGEESAEAVDVRMLKQNSQPFNFDVRSDYIGEIKPGQEGTAIFNIDVTNDAELKKYNLQLILRSKGDSDEGDDNIYTYTRSINFDVTKKSINWIMWTGIGAIIIVILYILLKGNNKKWKLKF